MRGDDSVLSSGLKQCFLPEDQEVQGVPCRSSGILRPDAGVKFKESGKLESCTLAKDFAEMKKGERWVGK